MTTSTVTSSCIKTGTPFGQKARVFLNELRYLFELTGQIYLYRRTPR